MYDLTWMRGDASAGLPRFVDAAGQVVPFRPGNTWFDVLSSDSPTTFDASQGVFSARFKAPKPLPTATPAPGDAPAAARAAAGTRTIECTKGREGTRRRETCQVWET